MAATAQAAEIVELNRMLRLSTDELDRTNKRLDESQGMRISIYPEILFMCNRFDTD